MTPIQLTREEAEALKAYFRWTYLPYTDRGQVLHRLLNRIDLALQEVA